MRVFHLIILVITRFSILSILVNLCARALFIEPFKCIDSDKKMGLKIKCSDIESAQGLEASCPYVAQGENMEELMADLGKHAKEVHAYTDEMLQAPETVALIKATVIKE